MRLAKNVTLKHFKTHTSNLHSGPIYEAMTGAKTIGDEAHHSEKRKKNRTLTTKKNTLSSSNNNHGKLVKKVRKTFFSSGTRQKKNSVRGIA